MRDQTISPGLEMPRSVEPPLGKYIAGWRSPVLLIHADDDRNVHFTETVDLVRRLQARGVPYEEMVVVDDTHHFMLHANQLRVDLAIADFLERKLSPGAPAPK